MTEAAERDADHERVDAGVGDDQVGAAAQHAQGHAALARPRVSRAHRGLVGGLHEPARHAAHAERGQRPQRHALGDGERARAHGINRVARQGPPVHDSPARVSVRVHRARSCTRAGWPAHSSTRSAHTR